MEILIYLTNPETERKTSHYAVALTATNNNDVAMGLVNFHLENIGKVQWAWSKLRLEDSIPVDFFSPGISGLSTITTVTTGIPG